METPETVYVVYRNFSRNERFPQWRVISRRFDTEAQAQSFKSGQPRDYALEVRPVAA